MLRRQRWQIGPVGSITVVAQVPQAELYRYASQLRAMTAGRGKHRESYSHYEELPGEMEQKVVAALKAEKEKLARQARTLEEEKAQLAVSEAELRAAWLEERAKRRGRKKP